VPALPSWLTETLWDHFAALLPQRPAYDPAHPLGCHRPRISDRIVFDKLLQLLQFGCSYQAIADTTCSATTIRNRRDEWIQLGVFARLKQIALDSYDRIVGFVLDQIAVDGSIAKAAGRSPVDRGKQGLKRAGMTPRLPARPPSLARRAAEAATETRRGADAPGHGRTPSGRSGPSGARPTSPPYRGRGRPWRPAWSGSRRRWRWADRAT
jgi:transposase